ncbi:MAG: DUF523 domain-containing protein [Bacilli bacterium]|jgi:uncharacterized protein YbbK (DUF523 family)|nr:DUF523 domain-containing protein [Bacilli bacterium]
MPARKTDKETILISACLLGNKVRYDGKGQEAMYAKMLAEYFNVIPICPEVDGGLPIPRPKAEIKDGKVINEKGKDVTSFYEKGAEAALSIAKRFNVSLAILKERSPSCGSSLIHNGLFDGDLLPGQGITTALLRKNGIDVISENQIKDLIERKAKEQGDL